MATPLGIRWQKPFCNDAISQSRWVWELKERLEDAHKFVREYTGRKYHEKKLNWGNFISGDMLFFLKKFPRHKS